MRLFFISMNVPKALFSMGVINGKMCSSRSAAKDATSIRWANVKSGDANQKRLVEQL